MKKRGRKKQMTLGRWRNSAVLAARVKTILKKRDKADAESITDVTIRLGSLCRRTLRSQGLTNEQRARLQQLAVRAKPSEITRVLQSWRFRLLERAVRILERQPHVQEMRWA